MAKSSIGLLIMGLMTGAATFADTAPDLRLPPRQSVAEVPECAPAFRQEFVHYRAVQAQDQEVWARVVLRQMRTTSVEMSAALSETAREASRSMLARARSFRERHPGRIYCMVTGPDPVVFDSYAYDRSAEVMAQAFAALSDLNH